MGLYFRVQHAPNPSDIPVVMVHGLFGSMENLGAIARVLANTFTVYSVDLPNHGRSPHRNSMSLQSLAQALLGWLDENNISKAHFVGHSLGGKAIMELALLAPTRCVKLAVIDIAPVAYEPHHNDVFKGLLAIDPSKLQTRSDADALLKEVVPEVAVRSFLLKNLVKSDQGFHWRMNLPVIHRDYPLLIAANRTAKPSLQNEILFIKGGNSPYILESHRDAIAQRFPNAKLRIVAGTGHWLHAEKPEHVAKLLERFLAG